MNDYKQGDIVKLTNGTTGKIVSTQNGYSTVKYRFMADGEELSYLVEEQDIDPKWSYLQYFDPTFEIDS